jgi:hypothetical protein
MIPVLVTAVRNRRELREIQPRRRTIPARQILDRWEPGARTPVPGSRKTSAGAKETDAVTTPGSCTSPVPADPETRSLAAADTHTGDEGDSK